MRRADEKCATCKQLKRRVPIVRPAVENGNACVERIGSARKHREMNSRGETAKMFGVNGARTFAQAQTISENLRAAAALWVNESSGAVEAEKSSLQFRLRADGFNDIVAGGKCT